MDVVAATMPCCFCGRPSNGEWQEVSGWEQRRTGGGLHALTERRPTGRFACDECVRKKRMGLSTNQDGLF